MDLIPSVVLAALLLAAAGYAQHQIPRYTATSEKIMLARAVLLAVGVASGAVSAAIYGIDTVAGLLAFLIGFGAVHVPAAFILLIKRGRGAGKS